MLLQKERDQACEESRDERQRWDLEIKEAMKERDKALEQCERTCQRKWRG